MVAKIESAFSYPVIVKPVNLGSSVGISKAADRASLERALDTALGFSARVLVEPAVENSAGNQLRGSGGHQRRPSLCL